MSEMCPPHLIALAERLAEASAAVLRRYYRTPFVIDDKADHTPVTIADREAERIVRAILEVERPGDGIVGEEFGAKKPDAEYVWVIDPIDGTKSFIVGRPLFASLVALVHRGRPIIGVIDQPIIGDRWVGALGRPTTLNRVPVTVRPCAGLGSAILGATSPDIFDAAEWGAFLRVAGAARATVWGGDGHAYGLLASGYYDLIIESSLKFYDYAALAPVISGAGGYISDWHGQSLTTNSDGRILAAGDARVYTEAQALLGQTL